MQSGFNSQLHRSLGGQPPDPFLGSGEAGREIEGPMAMVIFGGLFASTALNLLVLPTLALRYGWFEAAEAPGEMPESAWNGIGRPASPAD